MNFRQSWKWERRKRKRKLNGPVVRNWNRVRDISNRYRNWWERFNGELPSLRGGRATDCCRPVVGRSLLKAPGRYGWRHLASPSLSFPGYWLGSRNGNCYRWRLSNKTADIRYPGENSHGFRCGCFNEERSESLFLTFPLFSNHQNPIVRK